jgi:hypothetical protein
VQIARLINEPEGETVLEIASSHLSACVLYKKKWIKGALSKGRSDHAAKNVIVASLGREPKRAVFAWKGRS